MDERDFGLLHSSEWRGLFQHLQDRAKIYVGVFVLGFVAGYPAAEVLIEWFLDAEGFIPEGVQIIILQPLEVILLQLRIAAQIGFGLLVVMLILDLAWSGRSVLSRTSRSVAEGAGVAKITMILLIILVLGGLGAAYAHTVLIPFLLQYLSEDAAASGLQSTWQLQSWIGFVTGLYFSSIVGFQVPVVIVVLLRAGVIERSAIIENRGFLWFAALFLGALISPPDPISLFLVGGPMLVLLELALVYDRAFAPRG